MALSSLPLRSSFIVLVLFGNFSVVLPEWPARFFWVYAQVLAVTLLLLATALSNYGVVHSIPFFVSLLAMIWSIQHGIAPFAQVTLLAALVTASFYMCCIKRDVAAG